MIDTPATINQSRHHDHLQRMLALAVRGVEDELATVLPEGRAKTSAGMIAVMLRFVARELEQPSSVFGLPEGRLIDPCGLPTVEAINAIRAQRDEFEAQGAAEQALELPARPPSAEEALKIDPGKLADYLVSSGVARSKACVTDITKLLGGLSKETFIVSAVMDGRECKLVFRRDAKDSPVETRVADEYRVMTKLSAAGLPVPAPIWLEEDGSVFGQPFVLTTWHPGRSITHTQGLVVDPEQAEAARELAAFLGKLHALDVSVVADLAKPGLATTRDYLLDQIEIAEASWRRRSTPDSPVLATAFEWLKANVPDASEERPAIVHGDAGLHNLMMHSGRISAMLDWELTHLGDPVEDLAYCRTWVDPLLPWDEFLEIYYANGGRPYRAEREFFYGMLSEVRVAVMSSNCVSIIDKAEHPELGWAFGRVYYLRFFGGKVADRLLSLR